MQTPKYKKKQKFLSGHASAYTPLSRILWTLLISSDDHFEICGRFRVSTLITKPLDHGRNS